MRTPPVAGDGEVVGVAGLGEVVGIAGLGEVVGVTGVGEVVGIAGLGEVVGVCEVVGITDVTVFACMVVDVAATGTRAGVGVGGITSAPPLRARRFRVNRDSAFKSASVNSTLTSFIILQWIAIFCTFQDFQQDSKN